MPKRKTHKEFINDLNTINPNISILSNYQSAHTKVRCKCDVCGWTFEMKPNSLLNGRGCPNCAKKRQRESQMTTNENFIEKLNLCNPYITPLEKYNGRHNKILCKCTIHNVEWKTRPSELLNGHGCPQCYSERIGKSLKLSEDDFKKQLSIKNPYIILIGGYTKVNSNADCQCLICNHVWNTFLGNLIYGKVTGCPNCKSYSKGEESIRDFLSKNNILFDLHKTYEGLIGLGGKQLSYDFYITNLNLLIEYQGQQHEFPVQFGGISKEDAIKNFSIQQEHDRRKREFAYNNNIDLLEIWYRDYLNIDKILYENLIK